MGVGGNSVTSMLVERYHVEKAKIKPKNDIEAKLKSSRPNSPKRPKRAKRPNPKFQGQGQSKKAKFD